MNCSYVFSIIALCLSSFTFLRADSFGDLEDFSITEDASKDLFREKKVLTLPLKKTTSLMEELQESENSIAPKELQKNRNRTTFKEKKVFQFTQKKEGFSKKQSAQLDPNEEDLYPKRKNKSKEKELDKSLGLDTILDDKKDIIKDSKSDVIYIFLTVTALGFLFLVWWYQKHMKQKLSGAGVPVSVLGQTWLDGTTKIILLKVGAKVITLAKSNSFCTTLDITSDPDEVNFLTISSDMPSEATNSFKDTFSKAQKQDPSKKKAPHSAEMRQELNELKKQLGQM